MEFHQGYYAVIQFCPDPSRLEAANVGVLLFCPALRFLRARLSRNNARIDKFFGTQDWEFIKAQKQAIEERLIADAAHFRTLDDLQNYAARRANEIQISMPRPMKVIDAEKDLEQLFILLAGERGQRKPIPAEGALIDESVTEADGAKRRPRTRADALLKKAITEAGIEQLLKRNVTVSVPTVRRTITAPYGYRNGRFTLIEPERFERSDNEKVFTRTCRRAVEGQLLYETPDPQLGDLQLVVVGQFGPESQERIDGVRTILAKHSVKLYTFDELEFLFADVQRSAALHAAN